MLQRLFPAIFLLVISLIAFRFLFFTGYIEFQKAGFRKQLINDKEARVIEFKFDSSSIFVDKNGFEWKENNNELVVNGNYYEVVSISKMNSIFIVKVISDKAEDALFHAYFSINKDYNKGFIDLVKLLLEFNCIDENYISCLHHYPQVVNKKQNSEVHFAASYYFLKQIKPPQVA